MIVTFCGHSQFQKTSEYEAVLMAFLEKTIGDQPAEMYLGGYGGFDSFAYSCCKTYRETHPNISLWLITPYMTESYQKNYLNDQKTRYDGIIYPEIENKPQRFAISYRNKWMVEKADCIVAYVDHTWGGAYATYQYAVARGKRVFNLGKIPR